MDDKDKGDDHDVGYDDDEVDDDHDVSDYDNDNHLAGFSGVIFVAWDISSVFVFLHLIYININNIINNIINIIINIIMSSSNCTITSIIINVIITRKKFILKNVIFVKLSEKS